MSICSFFGIRVSLKRIPERLAAAILNYTCSIATIDFFSSQTLVLSIRIIR